MKVTYTKSPLVVAVESQDEANEKRKLRIITELYKTGRVDGLYFGKASKSSMNPIKYYIKSGLFKKRVADQELVEDCYNELFCHLQEMSPAKFCKIYDESPNKLLATALRIIALKCFAIDPRHGNPKHSFIESILFASVEGGAYRVDSGEITLDTEGDRKAGVNYDDDKCFNKWNESTVVLQNDPDEPSEFERQYGFTPEQIISELSPQQRADFYESLGSQPKGRQSKDKIARRADLSRHLIEIKDSLSISYEIS